MLRLMVGQRVCERLCRLKVGTPETAPDGALFRSLKAEACASWSQAEIRCPALVFDPSATYRRQMVAPVVGMLLATLLVVAGTAVLVLVISPTSWRLRTRAVIEARILCRHPDAPQTRPIEEVVVLAHRLGLRFHYPAAGVRFAKLEGVRQAYDGVLAEACACLGLTHLLAVLPPGPELDAERSRVEWALECAGFELGLQA